MTSARGSSALDDSMMVVNIETANQSKMLKKAPSTKHRQSGKEDSSAASNYAQKLNSDLISQALQGDINLPPVPDSPSLQHQNLPRKQPVKARLAVGRRQSANSQKNPSSRGSQQRRPPSNEMAHTRVSSRSGAAQSTHSQAHHYGHAYEPNLSGREVMRQKSRQSLGGSTNDSNVGLSHPRRQSSNAVKPSLPPAPGIGKRANSRQKLRQSYQNNDQPIDSQQVDAGALPPRRPTQTSSARSLQPLTSPQGSETNKGPTKKTSHTLNPNQVVPTPPGHQKAESKKVAQLKTSVDKQRELLEKLQQDKLRTEMELRQNSSMMERKIQTLAEERQNVQALLLRATITIQRFARGFITRLKVKRVYHLQMEFEKARLDDALAQMQAMIAEQVKNAPITPMKEPGEETQSARSKPETQKDSPGALSAKVQVYPKEQTDELKQESPQPIKEDQVSASSDQAQEPKPEFQSEASEIVSSPKREALDDKPEVFVPAKIDLSREPVSERQQVSNNQVAEEATSSQGVLPQDVSDVQRVNTQSATVVDSDERGILDQIEAAQSDYDLDLDDQKYEKSAIVIQRQARVMISRNNFRVALYKLILLKNIVETKMHKERMQVLYAFEQLIINTEDPEGSQEEDAEVDEREVQAQQLKFIEQTGLTREQIQEVLANESDPYLRQQLEELYNPLVFKGINEAEQYFENTEDIINEEDLEESVCESRKQSPNPRHEKSVEGRVGATQIDLSKINETTSGDAQASARLTEKSKAALSKRSSEAASLAQRSEPAASGRTETASQGAATSQSKQSQAKKQNSSEALAQLDQSKNFSQKLRESLASNSIAAATESGSKQTTPHENKVSEEKSQVSTQPKTTSVIASKPGSAASATAKTQVPKAVPPRVPPHKAGPKQSAPSRPLQERTISQTNTAKTASQTRLPVGKPNPQSKAPVGAPQVKPAPSRLTKRDSAMSSEQGRVAQAAAASVRKAPSLISSKPGSATPTTSAKESSQKPVPPRAAAPTSNSSLGSKEPKAVAHQVTRKDILEFSGVSPESNLQAEQSGQINIVTGAHTGPGNAFSSSQSSTMRHSDSGSINGRSSKPRDTSIIERNKAKLAELNEKKKQEQLQKKAEEFKKELDKEAAAKPPRPFDPARLSSLSQPKPKRKDPNTRTEPKLKKVSAQTRKQLQDRAWRVKNRQEEALQKQRQGKVLAITDGQTQGTNLVMVTDDDKADEKRRSNILKSREIRKRSAKGPRDGSKGRGSVFDRLSHASQRNNQKGQGEQSGPSTQARASNDPNYQALVPVTTGFDQTRLHSGQVLSIEANPGDAEPSKPTQDVRQSYEFVVRQDGRVTGGQPSSKGSNRIYKQPSSNINRSLLNSKRDSHGDDAFELAGPTLTDYESDTNLKLADPKQPVNQGFNPDAFSIRQLRKPSAQAIEQQREDDELDDMPFIVKNAPKGKKHTASLTVSSKQRERNHQLEPIAMDAETRAQQERKAVNGASKLSLDKHQVTIQSDYAHQSRAQPHQTSVHPDGSTLHMFGNPKTATSQEQLDGPHGQVVVAKPDEQKERDWLLDPVNLYMRGMAQRREQMRKLQAQIGQEQRAEINRRVAHFKM